MAGRPLELRSVDKAQLTGNFERCPECHSLLDNGIRAAQAISPNFSHRSHMDRGASCDACHLRPTHESGGTRRPPMEKCFSCHSQDDGRSPSGACDLCHPASFELRPADHKDEEWLPVPAKMDAVSGKHTSTNPQDLDDRCKLCHTQTFCSDCHQMGMPHPDDWKKGHAPTAREVGGTACDRCHQGKESCKSCHHQGYEPGGPTWISIHFQTAVQDGVEHCISCHSTRTCAHCHTTGEYKNLDQ